MYLWNEKSCVFQYLGNWEPVALAAIVFSLLHQFLKENFHILFEFLSNLFLSGGMIVIDNFFNDVISFSCCSSKTFKLFSIITNPVNFITNVQSGFLVHESWFIHKKFPEFSRFAYGKFYFLMFLIWKQ